MTKFAVGGDFCTDTRGMDHGIQSRLAQLAKFPEPHPSHFPEALEFFFQSHTSVVFTNKGAGEYHDQNAAAHPPENFTGRRTG